MFNGINSSVGLVLLVLVLFVALAVIPACQFRSEFSCTPFWGVLVAASFIIFFRHLSFLLHLVTLVLEKRVMDMHGDEVPILKDGSHLKVFRCGIKKRNYKQKKGAGL